MNVVRSLSLNGIVFMVLVSLLACVSPEEAEERRRDAFDLEGQYKTEQGNGSEVGMSFAISNKDGVRSDISVTLDRSSGLTQDEISLFQANGFDVDEVRNLVLSRPIVMDARYRDNNISTDNGETSVFSVCSKTLSRISLSAAADWETAEFSICMRGTVTKATRVMNGYLISQIYRSRKAKDKLTGEDYTQVDWVEERMSFSTELSESFLPKQYIGTWIGEVFEKQRSNSLSQIVGLRIRNVGEAEVAAFPLYRVVSTGGTEEKEQNKIAYASQEFTFEMISETYNELRDEEFPIIRMVYKNPAGTQRLLFVGSVWSLGTFSGNILMLEDGVESEVGSFRFKKD